MTWMHISEIDEQSTPNEIVKKYHRTAAVFKKYNIEYCCSGKWPLKLVCEMKDMPAEALLQEIKEAARVISLPASLPYHDWKVDFLTDYIVHVHHQYLRQSLPAIGEQLSNFVREHAKKYPQLPELESQFYRLEKTILPHLSQEEDIIFPYIRQIVHAYNSKETYARLLVRTLRKPVEDIMNHEHDFMEKLLHSFRVITNNYTPPEAACASHRLSYSLLKELDEDLVQHVYLENNILFPKAIAMEKELLERNG